ncbi:GNAT family N-acetyltransferase [Mycetocola reblochoni]|uniref:GNAT family N-acetyltransferase n=1 Tax=Mycetocola reblochoni TaxID=331618 RepID=A0A3L6ZT00_9MICO|nr:GNAT family N-acetyltransferase [Mycetocola reblochoni]
MEPITGADLTEWIERSVSEYTADLVRLGRDHASAQAVARRSVAAQFPEGRVPPGQHVFHIVHDGRRVGYLWLGEAASRGGDGGVQWWVWDVLVDESARGRGLGRGTMLRAERFARENGADELGLSVFGFNTGAQRLYASLGYETTSIKMSKRLD